jgi:hypothetical protein
MCFDLPFLVCWMHYLEIFNHHVQEWPEHKQLLQEVAEFLSALDSDRKHLLRRNVLVEDWQVVDRTIRELKLELNKVIRLKDSNERTGSFKFALKYKTAIYNGQQLRASMARLQELRNRMDFLKAKLKDQRTHFREERGKTDEALAQHFMRQLTLDSSSYLKSF